MEPNPARPRSDPLPVPLPRPRERGPGRGGTLKNARPRVIRSHPCPPIPSPRAAGRGLGRGEARAARRPADPLPVPLPQPRERGPGRGGTLKNPRPRVIRSHPCPPIPSPRAAGRGLGRGVVASQWSCRRPSPCPWSGCSSRSATLPAPSPGLPAPGLPARARSPDGSPAPGSSSCAAGLARRWMRRGRRCRPGRVGIACGRSCLGRARSRHRCGRHGAR